MAGSDEVGAEKAGQIECIVCGEYYWYPGTPHMRTHAAEQPTDYYQYKEYVAETYDLDEDHELLADDTVINPNKWAEVRDDYPGIDIGFEPK